MSCPSLPPWLDHSNYIWWRVQVMKLVIMQLSPPPVTSSERLKKITKYCSFNNCGISEIQNRYIRNIEAGRCCCSNPLGERILLLSSSSQPFPHLIRRYIT
jgi:hypothetical protein